MFRLANIKMKPKLITLFLTVGIVPLAIVAWIAFQKANSALDEANTLAGDALKKQVFDQLAAVGEIKRGAVERYFQTINDQIITFSEDRMVVNAMREFRAYFQAYRTNASLSVEDLERMRLELRAYYTNAFTQEYRNQNNGRSPNVAGYYGNLDDDSVALQHAYIQANRHPLGSKHLLDRADDGTLYSELHNKVHPVIRSYLEKFGYYDIFLADPETGDIVYSVFKELDYTTSLINGPYAGTNFGEAFRRANQLTDKDAVVLVDFEQYPPSYEAPASFIASPIFDGGEKIGVALFQMPLDRITEVMSQRAGLGKTGETYLVGPDFLMRSDSYLDPENRSVAASFRNPGKGKVETEASRAALAGRTGMDVITGYHGNRILSDYRPVEIGGITWALLAEIDEAEAFAAVAQMEENAASAQSSLLTWVVSVGGVATVVIFFVALGVALMIARPVCSVSKTAARIAAGDIDQEVDYQSQDEIGALADSFRQVIEVVKGLVNETRVLVQSAQEGKLSVRGDTARFQGAYADLVGGINEMLDVTLLPVQEASETLEQVAARDLTARVKGTYQGDHARIKEALNTAVENLDTALLQVVVSTEQVNSASGQISSGSQTLAQGASEQASSLEEVSSSLEEMESMTQQNAANAQEARGMADNARSSAEKGVESMRNLSQAVDRIKTSSDETAKIVKTIDEIAFQTNLLALNAAVEAARAGEAGKGFAVVAEEVRNLAMRSAQAAKDTASLIEESVKNAEEGVSLNQEVLSKFEEINGQVQKVSEVTSEIAAGSDQQSEGIGQITTAIGQLNQVTQQNAANSQESASSAEELSAQAEEVQSLVGGFKLSREGRRTVQPDVLPVVEAEPQRVSVDGIDGNGKVNRQGQWPNRY